MDALESNLRQLGIMHPDWMVIILASFDNFADFVDDLWSQVPNAQVTPSGSVAR